MSYLVKHRDRPRVFGTHQQAHSFAKHLATKKGIKVQITGERRGDFSEWVSPRSYGYVNPEPQKKKKEPQKKYYGPKRNRNFLSSLFT